MFSGLVPRMFATHVPLVTVLLLSVLGCAKKQVTEGDRESSVIGGLSTPAKALTATVAAINIVDDRPDVAPEGRRLHMPEWTIVGQEDRIAPNLDDRDRGLIRSEVERYFEPGSVTVTVDVYVLEGTQTFTVGERMETIAASFALRIEVANHADVHDVRTAVGEAASEHESLDITDENVNEAYERVIRESIRNAFELIVSTKRG